MLTKLLQRLRPLVLEEGSSNTSPAVALAYIRITRAIIVVGALVVLYTHQDLGALAFHAAGRADLSVAPTHRLLWVALPSIIAGLHLLYLYLVTDLLVFSRPIHAITRQQFQLPVILFVAYITTALAPLLKMIHPVWSIRADQASYLFFVLLYFTWFLRDFSELRLEPLTAQRRTEARIWCLIEVLFVAVLLHSFVFYVPTSGVPSSFLGKFTATSVATAAGELFTPKDLSIVCCLAFYSVWQYLNREGALARYSNVYPDYVSNNSPVTPALPRTLANELQSPVALLDLGCAHGARAAELVSALTALNLSFSRVTGLDRDADFGPLFTAQAVPGGPPWKFAGVEDEVDPAEYSLIYISHLIYDRRPLRSALRLLRRSKPGTIVLVRGRGPRSLFHVASLGTAERVWRPAATHLWRETHLRQLLDRGGLERVAPGPLMPDAVLPQEYSLSGSSIRSLHQLLEILYGRNMAARARSYLEKLMETGAQVVPNDDELYIFRVKERSGTQAVTSSPG